MRKFICMKLTSIILIVIFITSNVPLVFAEETVKATDAAVTTVNVWDMDTYQTYLENHKDATIPDQSVTVNAINYTAIEGESMILDGYLEETQKVLYTPGEGSVEYQYDIQQSGWYSLELTMGTIEGKSGTIERCIYIDGKVPYVEMSSVVFHRIFKDAGPITQGKDGNDISPAQVEVFAWQTGYAMDSFGFFTDPLQIYLEQGKHTLKVVSIKEPVVLKTIVFKPQPKLPTYSEVIASYRTKGYQKATKEIVLQAEKTYQKSDTTIYPVYDRGSAAMVPYSADRIRLNMIGGDKWQSSGQWITWETTPEESGLYKIVTRFKQDAMGGMYVSRKLSINGEVPFEEAKKIRFPYDSGWQTKALGDGQEDFYFYFEKGKHYKIKLEVTIGDLADLIRKADEAVSALNDVYRKILMITGSVPDQFRDYKFDILIPDAIESMKKESAILGDVSTVLIQSVGKKGQNSAILDKLAYELGVMSQNPKKIAQELDAFKVNAGALATWVLESKKQALFLDWIEIMPVDAKIPKAEKGFLGQLWHVLSSFLNSFTTNYYEINAQNGSKDEKTIKVWVGTGAIGGRDQTQILRKMIDDTFTPKNNVRVDLQLVAGGTLLPATLAGEGPDVALQVGNGDPVNYAVRKAVMDLSTFPDFDEVVKRYDSSAMVPYQFNGKTYALPESYSFPMLFCRMDILNQINKVPPETWEDFRAMIPELKKRNMDIGIAHDFATYAMLLNQNNLDIYSDQGKSVLFDNIPAITVFQDWTELFSDYKLPLLYDFVNRFRTGEMPVGIADFTLYNQLTVFAPEIRGRWAFFPVPGTKQSDGTVKQTVIGGGSASIMMYACKEPEASWTFLKWWLDTDAQLRFSRELEDLLGPSARYPTANLKAFEQIAWNNQDYLNITKQRKFAQGIPEVPGGYMTSRYLNFAFLAVVNEKAEPSEQLRDYTELINEELQYKREEFGLS